MASVVTWQSLTSLSILFVTGSNLARLDHVTAPSAALFATGLAASALAYRLGWLPLKRDHPLWLLGSGFCSGILGGAYGMNGPPLAVYGSLRRWSPQHFRATLQTCYLPARLLGLWAHRHGRKSPARKPVLWPPPDLMTGPPFASTRTPKTSLAQRG